MKGWSAVRFPIPLQPVKRNLLSMRMEAGVETIWQVPDGSFSGDKKTMSTD